MSTPPAQVTLFSTCKPFTGETGCMQYNALSSWSQLGVPILLFGDEAGVAEAAQASGATHIPDIARSELGYPLVNHLFAAAKQYARTEYLAYINADIILTPSVLDSLAATLKQLPGTERLLLTGRRRTIPLSDRVSGETLENTLLTLDQKFGSWDKSHAIDLFIFHRSLLNDLEPLCVGRMQWDNWLLWKAREENATIVDASPSMLIYHPLHGHASNTDGWHQYSQDDDARNNRQRCAGNLLTLERAASYYLQEARLIPAQDFSLTGQFEPNREKLLAGAIAYLQQGVDHRPLKETVDCIRNLLWNNEIYFPLSSAETEYSHSNVREIIGASAEAVHRGDVKLGLELLQELLVTEFVHGLRSKLVTHNVCIWGCGAMGQRLQTLLRKKGIEFHGYLDSDQSLCSQRINGKPVLPKHWLENPQTRSKPPFVIIASMYYREIADNLQQIGLEYRKDFVA